MQRGIMLILLFAFVAQTCAEEAVNQKSTATFASELQEADLDATIVGAVSHGKTPACNGILCSYIQRGAVAAHSYQNGALKARRDCGIHCALPRDEGVQTPDLAPALGRRGVGVALGAFLAGAPQVTPARADDVFIDNDNFQDAKDGIKFVDIQVGRGDIPKKGDTLVTDYKLYVRGGSSKMAEGGDDFLFRAGIDFKKWDYAIFGTGKMPPMKVGGTRKLIIPPEFGYGKDGLGCRKSRPQCLVPPDSPLELIIILERFKIGDPTNPLKRLQVTDISAVDPDMQALGVAAALSMGVLVCSAVIVSAFRSRHRGFVAAEGPLLSS